MNIDAHRDATASLLTLLAKGDTAHSEQFYGGLARRLVANAMLVRGYLAPVVEEDRVVLQQQRSQQLEDVDWWAEHVSHLKREYEDAAAIYERVKAAHVTQLVDRDERAADEDDRRLSREAADEKAAAGMPKVAGL